MTQDHTETWTFTVAEALAKDVGRGIVRLDPKDMDGLGAKVGDIVRVMGNRATVGRALPAYPKDRGQSAVQIDGITRENAQTTLGERVRVQKTTFSEATATVLVPTTPSKVFVAGNDAAYLRKVLEGLPLIQGDRVRATLLGSRYQEFTVMETDPKGVVTVGPHTIIKMQEGNSSSREKIGTTYEDIGGLRKELQKIREMIELPLKHPELFERLGIGAPKGVLLHGPPGCGKTLIARAVANETDAAFYHVSGPEVIHKFYGESEAHLRAIFDKASQKAPAIIFLDEIDAIASRREDVRGDQQVERRVVAQLLALMDGLKSRGQVIVIGATNIPQVLDPALRRPGRFDREITISVPDKNGRLEILQIHTRGMPLASDVGLESLAHITHGFVGADLEALCREAAMTTLRRIMPRIQHDIDHISAELEVTMDAFLEALKEVEPSAIREVFTEIPNVHWEDVGGLEGAKQMLMEAIEWPLKHPDLFAMAKTSPPKGVLLHGVPGTGKTLLAKAVASQSGVNFISIKGPALISKWLGESEKGVREAFKKAKQASPCIVFFDEIDALAPVRGAGTDSPTTQRVVSQLLTELDGIEDLKGVIVLAATNRVDMIDPALLRAGRFDLQIELGIPDERARRQIFYIHTQGKPLARDVDLDLLARTTDGHSGADIEALCRRASMMAIREYLGNKDKGSGAPGPSTFAVSDRHFQQAMGR